MKWSELADQPCSLARAAAVIADRWTLLILRDCFLGVRRFEDFERRLGISRSLVSARLRKLVEAGVLRRQRYQERPARDEYRLTERGLDLHPVILGLVSWGDRHLDDGRGAPLLHRHRACGCDFAPVTVCSACGEPVGARDVETRPGPGFAPG